MVRPHHPYPHGTPTSSRSAHRGTSQSRSKATFMTSMRQAGHSTVSNSGERGLMDSRDLRNRRRKRLGVANPHARTHARSLNRTTLIIPRRCTYNSTPIPNEPREASQVTPLLPLTSKKSPWWSRSEQGRTKEEADQGRDEQTRYKPIPRTPTSCGCREGDQTPQGC